MRRPKRRNKPVRHFEFHRESRQTFLTPPQLELPNDNDAEPMIKTFDEWIKDNPPPDVQALAEKYGGLGLVPHEEWVRWDKELRDWQLKCQSRHLYE